jgi:hypothetical protein
MSRLTSFLIIVEKQSEESLIISLFVYLLQSEVRARAVPKFAGAIPNGPTK